MNWTDYRISKRKNKNPTLEDDIFLTDIIKSNGRDYNKAQEELLERYGNLAASISYKCRGRYVDYDDLLQSAKIGLLYAATKFDGSKGKFSTYATPWIWQYCLRLIENTGRTIRLPNHIQEALIRILREGIDLDNEELFKRIDLPKNRIQAAIDGYKTLTISVDDIKNYLYEDKNMDKVVLDSVMDGVLELFKRDELSLNVIKDYVGLGEEDHMLNIEELAVKYNKSVRDMTDILNTALNVIRDSGLLEEEVND